MCGYEITDEINYYLEQSKICLEKAKFYFDIQDSIMFIFYNNASNGFKIKAEKLKKDDV